jgi:hypothetical protein
MILSRAMDILFNYSQNAHFIKRKTGHTRMYTRFISLGLGTYDAVDIPAVIHASLTRLGDTAGVVDGCAIIAGLDSCLVPNTKIVPTYCCVFVEASQISTVGNILKDWS